jgi:hypothetical protein
MTANRLLIGCSAFHLDPEFRREVEAAGNLTAPLVDANHCNQMVYNMGTGGGGNCTRSRGSAIICPQCGYDMVTEARPEMGREGAALHELVANWHSLTSSVRAKIVDLLRSG